MIELNKKYQGFYHRLINRIQVKKKEGNDTAVDTLVELLTDEVYFQSKQGYDMATVENRIESVINGHKGYTEVPRFLGPYK